MDGVSNNFINKYGTYFVGVNRKATKLNSPSKTKDISYNLYQSGKSVNEIVTIRKLKKITIESHITHKMSEHPSDINMKRVGINDMVLRRIRDAVTKVGKTRLRPY